MTNKELKEKLDGLGIAYEAKAKKADLEALLPVSQDSDDEDSQAEVEKPESALEIEVSDPEVLRPESLPLVIKPKGGVWLNAEQEEYARTLNGYAYKNPEKFAEKKELLLERLYTLGDRPELLLKYKGLNAKMANNLSYDDKNSPNIIN